MDFECAVRWNQQHPIGTTVSIRRVDGTSFLAKTAGSAQQWGTFAIVPLEGQVGMWTTRALMPVELGDQAQQPEAAAILAEVSRGS